MRTALLFVLLISVATAAADQVLTRVIDTGAGHASITRMPGEATCG